MFCPRDPTSDHGGGVMRSKFIFLEHGHIVNQIKWNHECSNMVENILPARLFLAHLLLKMNRCLIEIGFGPACTKGGGGEGVL